MVFETSATHLAFRLGLEEIVGEGVDLLFCNREEALRRMRRAIMETVVEGVKTTLPLHQWILEQPEFESGAYNIHWLEKKLAQR